MRTAIRSPWNRIVAPALAVILTVGVGEAAQAACYDAAQQLPTRVVSQFINEPGKLLTQFPSGGPQMISLIRDLVASDPGTLSLVTELNTKANADQVQAIGTGLGQAALVCARTAQAFSDEIQRVAIAANNKAMTQAFGAVMGDQFLGLAAPAFGGGGAGTTGQIGSTGGTTPGSVGLSLTTSVSNTTTTASVGATPGTAAGAGAVTPGGPAGSLAGSALAGSLTGSVSAGIQGGTTLAESTEVLLSTGKSADTSNLVAGPNSSRSLSILGTVNTPNFAANFTASINSPISVSPSRPR
jgi:hypothetical protein